MAQDGRPPTPALQSVQAYADFLRFGVLPYAGGTFEQPGWLLEEMRTVHGIYQDERATIERKRAERDKARAGRRK